MLQSELFKLIAQNQNDIQTYLKMDHFNGCLEQYNSLIKNLQNHYNDFKKIAFETEKIVQMYSEKYIDKKFIIQFNCQEFHRVIFN